MSERTFFDLDEGEKISKILVDLVNQYPGLDSGVIEFAYLSETSGIGFFPSTGITLKVDERYITGFVHQIVNYPFEVIYRASPRNEEQKIRIKEFLDGLGRWLEQQPIIINGTTYKLEEYPELEGDRRVWDIFRTSSAHLMTAYPDGIQDWTITIEMDYENNFYKE